MKLYEVAFIQFLEWLTDGANEQRTLEKQNKWVKETTKKWRNSENVRSHWESVICSLVVGIVMIITIRVTVMISGIGQVGRGVNHCAHVLHADGHVHDRLVQGFFQSFAGRFEFLFIAKRVLLGAIRIISFSTYIFWKNGLLFWPSEN